MVIIKTTTTTKQTNKHSKKHDIFTIIEKWQHKLVKCVEQLKMFYLSNKKVTYKSQNVNRKHLKSNVYLKQIKSNNS